MDFPALGAASLSVHPLPAVPAVGDSMTIAPRRWVFRFDHDSGVSAAPVKQKLNKLNVDLINVFLPLNRVTYSNSLDYVVHSRD